MQVRGSNDDAHAMARQRTDYNTLETGTAGMATPALLPHPGAGPALCIGNGEVKLQVHRDGAPFDSAE